MKEKKQRIEEKTKNQIMTLNSYTKIQTKANIVDTKDFKNN